MILLHHVVMYGLTYHWCTSNQASDHQHELVWWLAGVGRMLAIERKGVLNEDDSFMHHCKEEEEAWRY